MKARVQDFNEKHHWPSDRRSDGLALKEYDDTRKTQAHDQRKKAV